MGVFILMSSMQLLIQNCDTSVNQNLVVKSAYRHNLKYKLSSISFNDLLFVQMLRLDQLGLEVRVDPEKDRKIITTQAKLVCLLLLAHEV